MPQDIAAAVRDKQRRDDIQIAELTNRGVPVAPVRTGTDGGMNPTYLAAVKKHGGPGTEIRTAAGTIPAHVNPPGAPTGDEPTGTIFASNDARPAPAPARGPGAPRPARGSSGIGGFFSGLFGAKAEPAEKPAAEPAAGKPKAAARPTQTAAAPARSAARRTRRPRPPPNRKRPPAKRPAEPEQPAQPAQPAQQAYAEPPKPANASLLNGAAPTVPSNGFDNRFGTWR